MIKTNLTKFPGVHRRADSGIYQFGLRAPVDLLTHFPSGWAVRCSLKTGDLREANDKAKALQAEWAGRFEALRSGKPRQVNLPEVRQQLFAHWERMLAKIDDNYAALTREQRDARAQGLTWQIEEMRDCLRDSSLPEWAEDFAKRIGEPSNPLIVAEVGGHLLMGYEVMHEALTDEKRTFPVRMAHIMARRSMVEITGIGTDAVQERYSRAAMPQIVKGGKKIADAYDAWAAKGRSTKTAQVFRRHAEQFAEFMGDPWLQAVDKNVANAFRDKLEEWAIANENTARTADNCLVSIRALFNVARDKGWLEGNAFDRVAATRGGKESEGREPWSHEELSVLFDDPIWTGYALPEDRKAGADAAYWIPLIACYSGARLSEIAQLWTDNIETGAGKETIEFRANTERSQKLKNEGSWRAVPIHSELVRLGFCEYVESLPKGPLFPRLPKDGINGAGAQFGQWFGIFKQAKGFNSPSKSFHSFRHLVATELRLEGATEAQADAITGHAGEGVARTVYAATIRRQAQRVRPTVELLNYSGLRIPRTYVR